MNTTITPRARWRSAWSQRRRGQLGAAYFSRSGALAFAADRALLDRERNPAFFPLACRLARFKATRQDERYWRWLCARGWL